MADGGELEQLYRDLGPKLRNFVRKHERREAEDICAQVWEQIARYHPQFVGDADGFEGLLYTIARRRLVDFHRRRASRRTEPVANETFAERASASSSTETEALDRLHARALLDDLIGVLTPVQVEVVYLRVVRGLSVERVALILNRSPGNVRIIHHRALKRLRMAPA